MMCSITELDQVMQSELDDAKGHAARKGEVQSGQRNERQRGMGQRNKCSSNVSDRDGLVREKGNRAMEATREKKRERVRRRNRPRYRR